MSEITQRMAVIFFFILVFTFLITDSIVTDNNYDANLLVVAVENNCSVVDTSSKLTITCPDPEIEAELNELKK